MARRVGNAEYQLRQLLVRKVAPVVVRLLGSGLKLAETRARRSLAIERHVTGSGIEIGAGAAPAIVPPGVRVTYVDKYDIETQRADPELAHLVFAAPDVIDEAETLKTFADQSQHFVLAFSVLEHVQDPIGTVRSFMRVLCPGGVAIVSVPDKTRYRLDTPRPLTTFEHLVRDAREGPAVSVSDHFREFGAVWYGMEGQKLQDFVENQVAVGGHCHFHVWDGESFLRFLLDARAEVGIDYELIELSRHGVETLIVLRRKG